MTTDFVVLGERRDNPSQLLLRGDDGGFYVYDIGSGRMSAAHADAAWAIDAVTPRPTEPRPDPRPIEAERP